MSTTTVTTSTLSAVCKLRWVPKQPTDQMTIRSLEAIRLMATAILREQDGKWDEANAAKMEAEKVLDREKREYLNGIQHTIGFVTGQTGLGYQGSEL